jgi:plasmid stabilization system protein ParE
MSHRLVLTQEAEAEIDEASRWYETNNPVLRAEFLRDVENALSTIQANPLQYQIIYRNIRRGCPSSLPIRFDVHRF